jgi:hypothetical protein
MLGLWLGEDDPLGVDDWLFVCDTLALTLCDGLADWLGEPEVLADPVWLPDWLWLCVLLPVDDVLWVSV